MSYNTHVLGGNSLIHAMLCKDLKTVDSQHFENYIDKWQSCSKESVKMMYCNNRAKYK